MVKPIPQFRPTLPLTLCAALALSGCATAIPPVEVTRFHVDNPAATGTVAVREMPNNPDVGLEFRTYASAVGRELQRVGFTESGDDGAEYIAYVSLRRAFRSPVDEGKHKPVSVGVGGAVGSGGYSGLGLGIGIDLSGPPKGLVTTELAVQLRRRADGAAIWEGRASTSAREGSPAAQPGLAAAKLASALLGGYPGESGRTITVK